MSHLESALEFVKENLSCAAANHPPVLTFTRLEKLVLRQLEKEWVQDANKIYYNSSWVSLVLFCNAKYLKQQPSLAELDEYKQSINQLNYWCLSLCGLKPMLTPTGDVIKAFVALRTSVIDAIENPTPESND